jgi:uncharacterized membrane protein
MRNQKIRNMTLDALFIALMVVVYFMQLGFVQLFPAFSITVLHVFVIIVALLGGYKRSWILGLTFGLISLIQALLTPITPFDYLFQNPLVSVLPRVLFAVFSGLIARAFIKQVANNKALLTVYSAVVAAISTIIHTVLVIGSIYIFYYDTASSGLGSNFFTVIWTIITTNGLLEVVVAAVIVPLVVVPLYKYSRRYYEHV